MFVKTKMIFRKEIFYLEIIDPMIYTMDHPKFIVSNKKDESISASRFKEMYDQGRAIKL